MAANIILFDSTELRDNLLPLTYTRPVANLRWGIMTIAEKWQKALPGEYSYQTVDYLREKFPLHEADTTTDLYIAGHVCPTGALVKAVEELPEATALTIGGSLVAHRGKHPDRFVEFEGEKPLMLTGLTDLFLYNERALADDFTALTAGRESRPLHHTCTVIGEALTPDGTPRIFLEEGAKARAAILNVEAGPIYIGRDAEIMEGSCIRGPLALCDHSYINMGSKIYGATTIGPYSKVGGELNNVIIIGYSNKAHDGFLGNAVIGEWCNLGANCVASNLKNDYSEIKLWNYPAQRFLRTGLQFCGLIMGDHTKAGINTMFNTATVVGVGCNIHGSGFPRNFVASFSEGGASGFSNVSLKKFFDIARRVMARRHVELTDADIAIFERIFEIAETLK